MKTHRLRSLLGLSSLAALMLSTSAYAASRIAVQPDHVIAPLGGEGLAMMQVQAGYPHTLTLDGVAKGPKCPAGSPSCGLIYDDELGLAGYSFVAESSFAGKSWFVISGADGKENSSVFQVTVVDQSPVQPVDRKTGGAVTLVARAWNAPIYPPRGIKWLNAADNSELTDGTNPSIGVIKGSGTASMTISGLKPGKWNFRAKVMSHNWTDFLTTQLYAVNVTDTPETVPTTARGSYIGIISPGAVNSNAGGRFDLTLGTSSMSASVKQAGLPAVSLSGGLPSVSGNLLTGVMSNITVTPPVVVTFQINTTTNRLVNAQVQRGDYTNPIIGWKKTAAPTAVQGRYNFALAMPAPTPPTLPMGRTWGSFVVGASGDYTISGRTACNEAFTCSAFIGPDANTANVAVYSVQPTNSVIAGTCIMDINNGLPHYLNNSGIRWYRPLNLTSIYPAGFNQAVSIDGGKYTGTSSLMTNIVTSSGGTADLTFAGTGLPARLNPNRPIIFSDYTATATVTNVPAKISYGDSLTSLNITTSTGLINSASSQFTLIDRGLIPFSGNISRPVKYSGIAFPTPNLPGNMSVEGYFMLPQLPSQIGQAADIRSGLWLLR